MGLANNAGLMDPSFLDALRGGRPGMPPLVGTDEVVKALAASLAALGGTAKQAALPRGRGLR
jgi:hypothetical protein